MNNEQCFDIVRSSETLLNLNYCLVECDAALFVAWVPVFLRNLQPPSIQPRRLSSRRQCA
jgi:hypothetical protein